MPSCIPPWEEWLTLNSETQEYYRHQFMTTVENRLDKLEKKKKLDIGTSAISGFLGGFVAMFSREFWT